MHKPLSLALATLALPLVAISTANGCTASPDSREDVAESKQELDTNCETATRDADPNGPDDQQTCNDPQSLTSGATYGKTDCPNRYLIGWGATVSPPMGTDTETIDVSWADTLPANATDCSNSQLILDVFWEASSMWHMKTCTKSGEWTDAGGCSFPHFDSSCNPNFSTQAGKVRTAAAALTHVCIGMACGDGYYKVKTTLEDQCVF
jgi:hypothetical protein